MPRIRERERRGIDYSIFAKVKCGLPKGVAPKTERKRKQRATRKHRRSVKEYVRERERGVCFASNVSPICRKQGVDRHEIVPLGVGGKVTPENCVWICRVCHDAAHGEPGVGTRLEFDWKDKADGMEPNAEERGNVRAVWLG